MPDKSMIQAINQAMAEEMGTDERVVVLGEDIGKSGGVFRATQGLYERFGPKRVIETPLSESAIVGVSIGLGLYGYHPIAEIQFADFIYPAFDQIASELSKIRYRSAGEYSCPVVIRAPYGAGVRGGPYHSQSIETFFTHIPGLKVVIPSSSTDAKGLLISAIRDPDPVIFLEPKRIYRSVRSEIREDYTIPIGKANTVLEGSDVSIFAYGAMIQIALEAAEICKNEGINSEIVDLRTLVPLDIVTILGSVKKTRRAVIVYEAPKTMGFGAELSALIAEEALEYLEAPILRVGGFDTPVPYSLDHLYVPSAIRVANAIRRVAKF
jgi:pyruvate dehydrogenase E1 component beta subunit